jgi:pyruvate decarboxylase
MTYPKSISIYYINMPSSSRFILNNDGYTIERLIHGLEAPYNNVPDWDYSKLCETFGPSFKSRYHRIATGSELVKLLVDPEFNAADRTQVS